jgi:hypothetical protein
MAAIAERHMLLYHIKGFAGFLWGRSAKLLLGRFAAIEKKDARRKLGNEAR